MLTRRTFLCTGASAVMVANSPSPLWGRSVPRILLKLASPYANSDLEFAPTAQLIFKEKVETATDGAVQVDILDNGIAGVGTRLLANVVRGSVQAGIVSVSNMAPLAPQVDLLNIPFWSADTRSYLNLITSPIWRENVIAAGNKRGIDILYHCVVGARTASSTRSFGKIIKDPEDIRDIAFRVPGSKILHQFYHQYGARVKKIAWGKTADVASRGGVDALDPSITGLYIGPGGLRDHIHSISSINSVHDGWVCAVNRDFLNALPYRLADQIREASYETFLEQIKLSEQANRNAKKAFQSMGVSFYTPTADQRNAWHAIAGPDRPLWDQVKKEFAGSLENFDAFYNAAKTNTAFTAKVS